MARILAVGIAARDVIIGVDAFPAEDDELRASGVELRVGGNAANTLSVLSQLGHRCVWAGVTAANRDGLDLMRDLEAAGVDCSSKTVPEGSVPTSYILLARTTGSRTIVHFRDLPEYSYHDFIELSLDSTDWLHFEGRNVHETRKMLVHARQTAPRIRRSLEIEKARPDIETLFPLADVIMFSRQYALATGHADAPALLRAVSQQAREAALVCAWGADGAWAIDRDGEEIRSEGFPPPELVDTLGAGDVFNAGIIHGMLEPSPLHETLTLACRLAGQKCGRPGVRCFPDGISHLAGEPTSARAPREVRTNDKPS